MTPEQKQFRIEQIEREAKLADPGRCLSEALQYDPALLARNYKSHIDFLLSLVKSQEADDLTPFCAVHAAIEQNGGLTLEVGNDCVACSLNERSAILNLIEPFAADDKSEDSLTVLQKIINSEPMRSACVLTIKKLRDQWLKREGIHLDSHGECASAAALAEHVSAANKIIRELESLSIEKSKE